MTRKLLERKTWLDYRALWSLETGRATNPHIESLRTIAAAFGMHTSDLIAFLEGEPTAADPRRREVLDLMAKLSDSQREAVVERARVLAELAET